MATQQFVTVTHSDLKDAAGKPATAEVPIEALEYYESVGWKADKAELKALADGVKELEAEAKAEAKVAASKP